MIDCNWESPIYLAVINFAISKWFHKLNEDQTIIPSGHPVTHRTSIDQVRFAMVHTIELLTFGAVK